jgi:hypothetical protein
VHERERERDGQRQRGDDAQQIDGPAGARISALEFVADAPDGEDVARLRGVALDLLAQAADVDGHGRGVAVEFVAPDVVEELRAGEDLMGMPREKPEQVELLGGERDVLAVEGDGAGGLVQRSVVERQALPGRPGRARSCRTAQDGFTRETRVLQG